jgi:histidine triad (HIT) family protein
VNQRVDSADSNCPFCAIARGEDKSVEIVCEAEEWVAFFPTEPATPGHTLVIPRLHVADLWDAPASLAGDLMAAVVRVGRAIRTALTPEGMNLISSSGAVAEQTVYHLPGIDLEGVADRIRAACADVSEGRQR